MYQALYRKYRPQTFSDVVGQSSVTDTLRAQIRSGKLSHAYLFTGTRGTGKTSCAKILAKAVNCLDPQDGNPCNHCAACRAIDAGSCMDVQEIDAASNNGVDSVRILRDEAIYTPGEVKMRVYIIDEVHMLSLSAFNALLKIIEEPPAHLLFILATTELHKVPATILSRCQRFSFRRLSNEDIASRLNYIAYQENIDIEPAATQLLARLADGGMRDGVSLLDQCASAVQGTLDVAGIDRALGLAGERKAAELLFAAAEHDSARALSLFSKLYADGKSLKALFDELSALLRDLLILKTAPKSGLHMLSGIASDDQLLPLREKLSPGELLWALKLIQQTTDTFGKNADNRVAAELCLLQLCDPGLRLDVQTMNARLSRLEQTVASGKFVRSAPAPEEDAERPPFPDDADDPFSGVPAEEAPQEEPEKQPEAPQTPFWPELCERLRDQFTQPVRGFFSPNGPIQPYLRGDELILACDDFSLDRIKRPEIDAILRQTASAVLNRPIRIRSVLKGQVSAGGADPMQGLLDFGAQHSDIITIK